MIATRIHAADGRTVVDPPTEELAYWRGQQGASIWVDLEAASPEELQLIAKVFDLTELTVEDFIQQGQRAKLEAFEGYVVLVIHGMKFHQEDLTVETPELDIVLGSNFLITNHSGHIPEILRDPQGAEHSCKIVGKSPTYAMYSVVDRLVDSYYPVLEAIDDAMDDLQGEVVVNPSPHLLQQIFVMRRSFGHLRKVISPQLEVFNRLIAREDEFIDPKYVVYFRDVYDHLIRTFELVDSYRDLASAAMDAYLSTIANRQNDVMKRLTLFTTIFMPITFLTGLFGQNFAHMPQVEHDTGYLWFVALGGMLLISVGQIIFYRRAGWL